MVTAFLPIWVLIAIGYAVARLGVLGSAATDVFGRFVVLVAMPAALFGTLSTAPLARFGGAGLVAFAGSAVLVGAVGLAVARWVLRRELGEQAIAGMASGYVNAGNLGLPVALQILGDASFVAVVLLFQVLVLAPLVLSTLDADRARRLAGEPGPGADRGRLARLVTLPLRNPIILACLAGVAVYAAGWRLPAPLTEVVELLGAAAVPTALIALGLSLHRPAGEVVEPPGERHRAELSLIVVLKIAVAPLAAYLLAHFVLGLAGPQLFAVVLCAALPTAQNTFLFARAYGADSRLARDSVLATTAVSMVSLTVVAALLSG